MEKRSTKFFYTGGLILAMCLVYFLLEVLGEKINLYGYMIGGGLAQILFGLYKKIEEDG